MTLLGQIEEDFPSFYDEGICNYRFLKDMEGYTYIREIDVAKHCLDKERVREAIEKYIVYCCQCGCTYGKDKLLKELGL